MQNKEQSGYFLKIVVTECFLVFIILLSVLVVKYIFKDAYTELKDWYQKNIAVDTDVEEVIGDYYEI